jgi:hypothetical protein
MKRPLGITRHIVEDDIKMDLKNLHIYLRIRTGLIWRRIRASVGLL